MAAISVRTIEYEDRSQRDAGVAQLLSDGYIIHHESPREVLLATSRPFETEQWMSVFYGLIFFIVPAVIYLLWWFSRPVSVVLLRVTESTV